MKIINNIGLSILIIGLLNIYNIVKEGGILNIPTIIQWGENKNIEIVELIKIDINNIKIILLISIVLYIILNIRMSSFILYNKNKKENKKEKNKEETIEYKVLIGLGLIGLIIMILSKELILLYLGLELYSFTIYVLLLIKESKIIKKISIIYLILSSLASGILLYSFELIYNKYGILDIEIIKIINNILPNNNIIIYLIIIGLLFKIGTIPFSYWLIRVYGDLEKRIFWYQLTIPKFIFFIIFIKFINIFANTLYFSNTTYFIYFFFIISYLSLLVGSIGGLFHKKDSLLLSYSSILNIGFILLSFSFLLLQFFFSPINHFIDFSYLPSLWILYHFFFVYIFNLLGIFTAIYLLGNSADIRNIRNYYYYPYFFLSYLILIFSFIGIPPFSGFISKFFIIFPFFFFSSYYSFFSYLSIFFFFLTSLFSSFLYLKFLFASSSSPSLTYFSTSTFLKKSDSSSLILSFFTIFSLTYSYLISFLIPLFQEIIF